MQTFLNLPAPLNEAIAGMLSEQPSNEWVKRAELLHTRYMSRERSQHDNYISDTSDVMAYLALRSAATYAQIASALLQVQEVIPSWQPKTLLDIGCGPGNGIWAAKTIWPGIESATGIDKLRDFLIAGKQLNEKAALPVSVSWQQRDAVEDLHHEKQSYDIVLIANVLNELNSTQAQHLLDYAYAHTAGIMVVIEPATPFGIDIIHTVSKNFSPQGFLLAPYIKNTFVSSAKEELHFSQRFIRPEFTRRVRQHMRQSSLMASDWEETKYAFVAVGRIPVETSVWARCIGSAQKQKGFLVIPLLTKNGIEQIRVLKRHKPQYTLAKNLRVGQTIHNESDLVV